MPEDGIREMGSIIPQAVPYQSTGDNYWANPCVTYCASNLK